MTGSTVDFTKMMYGKIAIWDNCYTNKRHAHMYILEIWLDDIIFYLQISDFFYIIYYVISISFFT